MEVKQTPPKEQRNPVMYVHSFRKAYMIKKRIIMKGVAALLCISRNTIMKGSSFTIFANL